MLAYKSRLKREEALRDKLQGKLRRAQTALANASAVPTLGSRTASRANSEEPANTLSKGSLSGAAGEKLLHFQTQVLLLLANKQPFCEAGQH